MSKHIISVNDDIWFFFIFIGFIGSYTLQAAFGNAVFSLNNDAKDQERLSK